MTHGRQHLVCHDPFRCTSLTRVPEDLRDERSSTFAVLLQSYLRNGPFDGSQDGPSAATQQVLQQFQHLQAFQ